jgi:hypothetical protein
MGLNRGSQISKSLAGIEASFKVIWMQCRDAARQYIVVLHVLAGATHSGLYITGLQGRQNCTVVVQCFAS